MFGGLLRLWRLWRQRAHDRRFLAQLSDRDLWDVGLTRGDVWREQSRPFWRTDGHDSAADRSGELRHSVRVHYPEARRQPGEARAVGTVRDGRVSSWWAQEH